MSKVSKRFETYAEEGRSASLYISADGNASLTLGYYDKAIEESVHKQFEPESEADALEYIDLIAESYKDMVRALFREAGP